MLISAKVDYAVQALVSLAANEGIPVQEATLADKQQIPAKLLEIILSELRRSDIVTNTRGNDGAYELTRPASEISIADVIRAVDGPLTEVNGERPESTHYDGSVEHLQEVWVAVRAALREVLEKTTLIDVATGKLPRHVRRLIDNADAWLPH